MEAAIKVNALTKRYGDSTAVDGVSFSVGRGEIFGLLGPNGAGKTTTVECLQGLRIPDSGQIALLEPGGTAAARTVRAQLGIQLQSTGLLPKQKVREQVALFGALFPSSLPVNEVLAMVNLEEKAGAATDTLSGGQRQRLAIALALVNDPALVFLDEPTTGLDPQARRGLWDVIRGLRGRGKTVLLTTHYMEEAEVLCDRVAVMDQGQIIAMDSPERLIHQHFEAVAIEFTPVIAPGAAEPDYHQLAGVNSVLRENGHVTLYSVDVPRTMAGLFEGAGGSAPQINGMTIRQATLEDVFLKLTGRRIRS